jgi:hypothetical protein
MVVTRFVGIVTASLRDPEQPKRLSRRVPIEGEARREPGFSQTVEVPYS